MSEQTKTPEVDNDVDVNDLLGDAPSAPAVESAAAEAVNEADSQPDEAAVSSDEDFFDSPDPDEPTDSEVDELQVAAAAVREAEETLRAAKAVYAEVASRHAARMQKPTPLHVQNRAVRDAQLREAEQRQAALDNIARMGFDPVAVNILAGGVKIPAAPRKPHPPLFPVLKSE